MHNLKVLARLPINPEISAVCDKGLIELFEGNWLEPVADILEKSLITNNVYTGRQWNSSRLEKLMVLILKNNTISFLQNQGLFFQRSRKTVCIMAKTD